MSAPTALTQVGAEDLRIVLAARSRSKPSATYVIVDARFGAAFKAQIKTKRQCQRGAAATLLSNSSHSVK